MIGTVDDAMAQIERLVAQSGGFGRHTFLCGQSGSGKTYSLGVLLERVNHPVAVDPDETLRAHAQERGWPILSLRG